MKISNFMSGSMIMNYRHSLVFLLIGMSTSGIFAEEQEEEVELSIELLEFLGEWETDEGEWIDPIELDDAYYAVLNSKVDELENE